MKLLVKTSLYYAIASLLFFALAGFIILFNFNKVIDNDINEFLINREEIATTQIINDIPIASLNNYEQIIKISVNKEETDNLKYLYKIKKEDRHILHHPFRLGFQCL